MKCKFNVTKSFVRGLLELHGYVVPNLKHIFIEHSPYSSIYRISLSGLYSFDFDSSTGCLSETYYDDDCIRHSKFICSVNFDSNGSLFEFYFDDNCVRHSRFIFKEV